MSELDGLLEAAEQCILLGGQLTDQHAEAFLSQHSLDTIERTITSSSPSEQQLGVLTSALNLCLGTHYGRGLLPSVLPHLQQALHSPAPVLRRFAVRQAGVLAASLAAQRPPQQQQAQAEPNEEEEAALQLLITGLQDATTGVAAEAGRALQAAAAADPQLAAALLGATTASSAMHHLTLSSSSSSSSAGAVNGSVHALASSIGQQVSSLLEGGDATLRGRLLGVVLPLVGQQLAAGSLPMTGTLQQLLKDLDNTGDPLAVAAALVQLQELAATSQGPAALLLHQLLMPRLLPLAGHQDTAAPALHLAAQLVAAASQALLGEAAAGAGAAAGSNGAANGVACNGAGAAAHSSSDSDMEVEEAGHMDTFAGPWAELRGDCPHPLLQLLTHMIEEGSTQQQLLALDAAGSLAASRGGAHLMAATPPASAPTPQSQPAASSQQPSLLYLVLQQALGRTTRAPEPRIAALQAAATWCGVDRAQAAGLQPAAAALSPAAESALQAGVWGVVGSSVGGAGGGRTPGEVWGWLVEQPFLELRLAAYRFLAGVLLRGWAASEAVTNATLMERLTGVTAESGQAACEWRYTGLRSLSRVVLAPDGSAAAPQWEAVAQQVAAAVRAGPYGAGAAERTAAVEAPQSMAV